MNNLPGLNFQLGEDIDALRDAVREFARHVANHALFVGVEVVGKAVGEEDFPNMSEVGEGGFGLDEARAAWKAAQTPATPVAKVASHSAHRSPSWSRSRKGGAVRVT